MVEWSTGDEHVGKDLHPQSDRKEKREKSKEAGGRRQEFAGPGYIAWFFISVGVRIDCSKLRLDYRDTIDESTFSVDLFLFFILFNLLDRLALKKGQITSYHLLSVQTCLHDLGI